MPEKENPAKPRHIYDVRADAECFNVVSALRAEIILFGRGSAEPLPERPYGHFLQFFNIAPDRLAVIYRRRPAMNIMRITFITSALILGSLISPRLRAEGTLRGRVMDEKNIPMKGANVGLRGPQGIKRTITDASGNYWFYGLTPGMYMIDFKVEGLHSEVIRCLEIRSSHTLIFNWAMDPNWDEGFINGCDHSRIDTSSSSTSLYIDRDMLEKFYR